MAFAWNDDTVATLRKLWALGYSTLDIGQRMGITKNAALGKAHRLGLASRPSPLPQGPRKERNTIRRVRGPTLPRLATLSVIPVAKQVVVKQVVVKQAPASTPKRLLPAFKPVTVVPPTLSKDACCFPLGEPGTRGFRFCDEPAIFNRPYCPAHHKIAYVSRPATGGLFRDDVSQAFVEARV